MKEIFLGTGADGGLPQIDCECSNCMNARQERIVRLRSCIMVENSRGRIFLDCGPDFRQQVLNAKIKLGDIDAVAIKLK